MFRGIQNPQNRLRIVVGCPDSIENPKSITKFDNLTNYGQIGIKQQYQQHKWVLIALWLAMAAILLINSTSRCGVCGHRDINQKKLRVKVRKLQWKGEMSPFPASTCNSGEMDNPPMVVHSLSCSPSFLEKRRKEDKERREEKMSKKCGGFEQKLWTCRFVGVSEGLRCPMEGRKVLVRLEWNRSIGKKLGFRKPPTHTSAWRAWRVISTAPPTMCCPALRREGHYGNIPHDATYDARDSMDKKKKFDNCVKFLSDCYGPIPGIYTDREETVLVLVEPYGFFTPPVAGADFRAAFIAKCFFGDFPTVSLRVVCLVRTISIGARVLKLEEEEADWTDFVTFWRVLRID
ncbi:hypothetical protein Sjap_005305 [Stephania japonica]|uniref:Uncharacterized protein n=1 Tax=Stephania japonica TaxID=461633 RepID=A0AAP0PIM6_9MAGN